MGRSFALASSSVVLTVLGGLAISLVSLASPERVASAQTGISVGGSVSTSPAPAGAPAAPPPPPRPVPPPPGPAGGPAPPPPPSCRGASASGGRGSPAERRSRCCGRVGGARQR